jgi:hypothetical protein
VRLTANGQSVTQPIVIKMDPRVKITPEVQQIFTLTTQVENDAREASRALKDARALIDQVRGRPQSAGNEALLKKLEEIAPVEAPRGGGRGGGGFGAEAPAVPPSLTNIAGQLVGSVMSMQASEMPPTAAELEACRRQEAAYTTVMAKWAALKNPKTNPSPK